MTELAVLERRPDTIDGLLGDPGPEPAPWVIEETTPDGAASWDRFVDDHVDGTMFHKWSWRCAICDVFPHDPIYLAAYRRDTVAGVLPMMLVNSRLFGRMLVSVPYGVGGGILADQPGAVEALFAAAAEHAERLRCRCIDFRSERAVLPGVPVTDPYVGFRRALPARAADVPGWLPRKARAAARNARSRFGVCIRAGEEHLGTVWRLYARSMRRLASIAYPRAFFECLLARHRGRCRVSLAEWKGEPVAGLMTFRFRDTVLPYFIGATEDAKRCSAANLLYLDAMERGVEEGCRFFDFGRTRRDNRGSFDFKRFHGFEPRPLAYQCHTLPGHRAPNLSPRQTRFELARRMWRRLPLGLTTALGGRLAAHIPG